MRRICMRFPKTIIYTSHSYIFVSAISNVFHEKDECYVSIDDKTSLSIVQPSKIFPFENTCQVLFVPWYANRWNIGQLKRKLIRNSNRNQIFHLDPFSKFFQNPGTNFSSLPFPEAFFHRMKLVMLSSVRCGFNEAEWLRILWLRAHSSTPRSALYEWNSH